MRRRAHAEQFEGLRAVQEEQIVNERKLREEERQERLRTVDVDWGRRRSLHAVQHRMSSIRICSRNASRRDHEYYEEEKPGWDGSTVVPPLPRN